MYPASPSAATVALQIGNDRSATAVFVGRFPGSARREHLDEVVLLHHRLCAAHSAGVFSANRRWLGWLARLARPRAFPVAWAHRSRTSAVGIWRPPRANQKKRVQIGQGFRQAANILEQSAMGKP